MTVHELTEMFPGTWEIDNVFIDCYLLKNVCGNEEYQIRHHIRWNTFSQSVSTNVSGVLSRSQTKMNVPPLLVKKFYKQHFVLCNFK